MKVVATSEFGKSLRKHFGGGWYAFVRFFDNMYWEIRNCPRRFARAMFWFQFMYHNEEWDSGYLFKVIDKRLSQIQHHIKKYGTHITANSLAKIIKLIRAYLELAQEDVTDSKAHKLFDAKYGETIMYSTPTDDAQCHTVHFKFSKCTTEEEQSHADKIMRRLCKRHERMRLEYKTKAFSLIGKYIEHWWD